MKVIRGIFLWAILCQATETIGFCQVDSGPAAQAPTDGKCADPLSFACASSTVGGAYGYITEVFKWFQTDDNNGPTTTDYLNQILSNDKEMIGELDTITDQLSDLGLALNQVGEQNQESWRTFISSELEAPVRDYVSEDAAYSLLKAPSSEDKAKHIQNLKVRYKNLQNAASHGLSFGSATAIPFAMTLLAEERAGSELDPAYTSRETELLLAERMEQLRSRLAGVDKLLDPSQPDSVTTALNANVKVIDTYKDLLLSRVGPYLNRNLILDSSVEHKGDQGSDFHCTWTVTTQHYIVVNGSERDGFTISGTQTNTQTSDKVCQRLSHCPVGKVCPVSYEIGPDPTPPPSLPQPNLIRSDWRTIFVQVQAIQQQWAKARAGTPVLQTAQALLLHTQAYLKSHLQALENDCKRMGTVKCSGTSTAK